MNCSRCASCSFRNSLRDITRLQHTSTVWNKKNHDLSRKKNVPPFSSFWLLFPAILALDSHNKECKITEGKKSRDNNASIKIVRTVQQFSSSSFFLCLLLGGKNFNSRWIIRIVPLAALRRLSFLLSSTRRANTRFHLYAHTNTNTHTHTHTHTHTCVRIYDVFCSMLAKQNLPCYFTFWLLLKRREVTTNTTHISKKYLNSIDSLWSFLFFSFFSFLFFFFLK